MKNKIGFMLLCAAVAMGSVNVSAYDRGDAEIDDFLQSKRQRLDELKELNQAIIDREREDAEQAAAAAAAQAAAAEEAQANRDAIDAFLRPYPDNSYAPYGRGPAPAPSQPATNPAAIPQPVVTTAAPPKPAAASANAPSGGIAPPPPAYSGPSPYPSTSSRGVDCSRIDPKSILPGGACDNTSRGSSTWKPQM